MVTPAGEPREHRQGSDGIRASAPRRHRHRTEATLSIPRIGALAIALLLHAGLLLSLLAPDADQPTRVSRAPVATVGALQVRWLVPPAVATPHLRRPPPAATRPMHATRAITPAVPSPPTASAALPAQAAPSARLQVSVPAPAATAPASDYVPGSGRFAVPAYGSSNVRVPGHDGPVRGAPTITMVDPRTQDVAGIVRFIGGLAGAVDPHCVDVGAWRGMTARERIAHHVTPDAIEATASRYGCAPPPALPGSPVYWRDRR